MSTFFAELEYKRGVSVSDAETSVKLLQTVVNAPHTTQPAKMIQEIAMEWICSLFSPQVHI